MAGETVRFVYADPAVLDRLIGRTLREVDLTVQVRHAPGFAVLREAEPHGSVVAIDARLKRWLTPGAGEPGQVRPRHNRAALGLGSGRAAIPSKHGESLMPRIAWSRLLPRHQRLVPFWVLAGLGIAAAWLLNGAGPDGLDSAGSAALPPPANAV